MAAVVYLIIGIAFIISVIFTLRAKTIKGCIAGAIITVLFASALVFSILADIQMRETPETRITMSISNEIISENIKFEKPMYIKKTEIIYNSFCTKDDFTTYFVKEYGGK